MIHMKKPLSALIILALALSLLAGTSCSRKPEVKQRKTILVTYSVLGAAVQELAGQDFDVKVAIPNGMDVHEWGPSAKDIEALTHADLIVKNGINLEEGMEGSLAQAKKAGVPIFTASDYVPVRRVRSGEGVGSEDPDQQAGAEDPHLWTDPSNIKAIILALSTELNRRFGVDLQAKAQSMATELDSLDAEIKAKADSLPTAKRKLVTGHESMGYFAQRYGFRLIGAVVPGLSSQAEVSAAELSALKKTIAESGASVIFTEVGTSESVVRALSSELRVKAVPLSTHLVGPDGTYSGYLRTLSNTVLDNLK
jgi:zinc/manganese transport system substrate-binding protein